MLFLVFYFYFLLCVYSVLLSCKGKQKEVKSSLPLLMLTFLGTKGETLHAITLKKSTTPRLDLFLSAANFQSNRTPSGNGKDLR